MSRLYDSGTLLWIDDEFEHNELMMKGRDVDMWRRLFGDVDNRVYRLLNLQLEIATSSDEAAERIKELSSRRHARRFVQAVVDLRIPKAGGGVPKKMFGLETARLLHENGIEFSILSSKSEAGKELAHWQLERVPYYIKKASPERAMMPEELTRRILSNFKNKISWIDLSSMLDAWGSSARSLQPLDIRGPVARKFPFFGSARDFVERWETRGFGIRGARALRNVLRAPYNHSDQFITQCIAIIMMSWTNRREMSLMYLDAADATSRRLLPEDSAALSSGQYVAIRFSGAGSTTLGEELDFLEFVLRRFPQTPIFFILPQDEHADPFLDVLAREYDTIFDDLPAVRVSNVVEREDLVRRVIEYHLQECRLAVGGGEDAPISDFYIRHPETLFHPVYWTFLLEADEVADDLTDPFEIQAAIYQVVSELPNWAGKDRQALIDGLALPLDKLFKPAEEIYARLQHNSWRWVAAAFRDWLLNSWRVPYNSIDIRRDSHTPEELQMWEDQCLSVARELAELYCKDAASHESGDTELGSAAAFLLHPAVSDMLSGETADADWLSLETMRWPHAHFPMPAALNRHLKQEGRYLLVQTDMLDMATVTRSGSRELLRLEEFAEVQHGRLENIRKNLKHLPAGWSQSARLIYDLLMSRQAMLVWEKPKERVRLWNAIQCVVKNATLVSFLFHTLVRHDGRITEDDEALLFGANNKSTGEGRLLNVIRQFRPQAITGILRPQFPRMRNLASDLNHLGRLSRYLMDFQRHEKHRYAEVISQGLQELTGAFAQLGDRDMDQMAMEDLLAGFESYEESLLPKLFDPNSALQSNAFFDTAYLPQRHGADLPINSGALRGTGLDLLLWMFEWSDHAFWSLRQVVYCDGYHLLALMRDNRNTSKDGTPSISNDVMASILELFILSFEGITAQLKYCLNAVGRSDIGDRFKLPDFDLRLPDLPADTNAAQFINVTDRAGKPGYVFSMRGFPGGASKSFLYYDEQMNAIEPKSEEVDRRRA